MKLLLRLTILIEFSCWGRTCPGGESNRVLCHPSKMQD